MTVSAQASVYPLRQERLGPGIEAMRLALERQGLEPLVGPMSTFVIGEASRVFTALSEGFERAAAGGDVAVVITVSNACPAGEPEAGCVADL
jgi:uncharacterized protein YqgV (UPF0045/DUF77 family)